MRTRSRANRGAGLTLIEVVFVILVLAALAGFVLPGLARYREESRRIRCRNNLNQLAKGMATYTNEHADSNFFPFPLGRTSDPSTYNGAEWLASLYWTGVVPDPGVFICPSSGDTNRDGVDIGLRRVAPTSGSQTVSYAGMHYDSRFGGATMPFYAYSHRSPPPTAPMASDDTQGDINHGSLRNGGMAVLFFDSHAEFRTHTELDLRHAVGDTSPDALLTELSN